MIPFVNIPEGLRVPPLRRGRQQPSESGNRRASAGLSSRRPCDRHGNARRACIVRAARASIPPLSASASTLRDQQRPAAQRPGRRALVACRRSGRGGRGNGLGRSSPPQAARAWSTSTSRASKPRSAQQSAQASEVASALADADQREPGVAGHGHGDDRYAAPRRATAAHLGNDIDAPIELCTAPSRARSCRPASPRLSRRRERRGRHLTSSPALANCSDLTF